jgi:heme/copper-type cytochrome/quinol oxidase subunit 1
MFFFGEFFFSFSLFAGFYYWIGKFTGLQYLETLGHIQIKSSFLGVEEKML